MNTGTATMNDEPMPDAPTDQLPPAPPPPQPRASWWHVPIARDPADKKVGGVIAGVTKAYGFDLRTTRFAVVVAALALPGVIALYIAAMIFLPKLPEPPQSLHDIVTERRRRPLWIALGVLALFSGFGSWAFFGGFGWGVTLLGLGVVLWLSPNFGSSFRSAPAPSPAPSSAPFPAPDASAATSAATSATSAVPGAAPVTTSVAGVTAPGAPRTGDPYPVPTAARAPRRRRHPIQALSLAGAFATALVMSLGNAADWWNASVYGTAVTVLAILIAGTIIGAIVNRSWFGIPMLLLLCIGTGGLLITHPNLDGGLGDRDLHPTTVADAQRNEQLGAGRLRIDLTDLPTTADARTVTVQAEVGYGQIRIVVPADAELHLTTHLGAGHVVLDGEELTAGLRHDDERVVPATAPAGESTRRTIVLDLQVGGGEISITRAG